MPEFWQVFDNWSCFLECTAPETTSAATDCSLLSMLQYKAGTCHGSTTLHPNVWQWNIMANLPNNSQDLELHRV